MTRRPRQGWAALEFPLSSSRPLPGRMRAVISGRRTAGSGPVDRRGSDRPASPLPPGRPWP